MHTILKITQPNLIFIPNLFGSANGANPTLLIDSQETKNNNLLPHLTYPYHYITHLWAFCINIY
jgi:hypothetical protein